MDTWLTTQQVAQLLGIHRTSVLALIEEGRLTARVYRYGARPTIRITSSEVQRFIERWADPDPDADRTR